VRVPPSHQQTKTTPLRCRFCLLCRDCTGIESVSGTDAGWRALNKQHLRAVCSPERHSHAGECAACKANSHIKASSARQNNHASLLLANCKKCEAELTPLALNKRTGKADTAAQMVSYLYKYVSKNLSGAEFNKKSYCISQNIAPPVRSVLMFRTYSEAFSAALEHFRTLVLPFGTERHRSRRDEGLDVLWLAAG